MSDYTKDSLPENEKLYRALFENMLNGFAYCQMLYDNGQPRDFIYLDVNKAFEVQTGLKNVVGKKVSEVIPGILETDPDLFLIYSQVALTGEPQFFEFFVKTLKMWFAISVYSPQKEYFVAVFDVITERKKAEEALRKSEQRFRHLAEALPQLVWTSTPDGRFDYLSPQWMAYTGVPEQKLLESAWLNLVHPDDRKKVREARRRAIGSGFMNLDLEFRIRRHDGVYRWFKTRAVPVYNESGRMDKLVGSNTDIEDLRLAEGRLSRILEETAGALASACEKRDQYTAGHQQRVAKLACAIANKLNLSYEQIEGIRVAGVLHDIGKLNVPIEILNKFGSLTDIEYSLIKTHAQVGHDIIKSIEFPWPVAEIVLQHHERLDGSGYPNGLTQTDILLEAQILAVADAVEAMASHRPYRPSLGIEKALKEISIQKGILYNSTVVEVCLLLFSELGFEF